MIKAVGEVGGEGGGDLGGGLAWGEVAGLIDAVARVAEGVVAPALDWSAAAHVGCAGPGEQEDGRRRERCECERGEANGRSAGEQHGLAGFVAAEAIEGVEFRRRFLGWQAGDLGEGFRIELGGGRDDEGDRLAEGDEVELAIGIEVGVFERGNLGDVRPFGANGLGEAFAAANDLAGPL